MKSCAKVIAIVLLIALHPGVALSQSSGTFVWSSDVRQTEVRVSLGGKLRKKRIFCNRKTPGKAEPVVGGYLFTSYRQLIRNLGTPRTASARSKLSTYNTLFYAGSKACSARRVPANPMPAPTANVPTGNFDSNGNLTQQGKVRFGVPASLWSLNANSSAGRAYFESNCGCHGEQGAHRSYSELRAVTSGSPMFFNASSLPDSALVNVLAFLRRFQR